MPSAHPSGNKSKSLNDPQRKEDGSTAFHRNDERAWKIAQIAATLASRYLILPGQPSDSASNDGDWTLARDEAAPELDRFFLSLLRRAEFLLLHGERRAGSIHAWQLFDPARYYSVREITKEFQLAGWTGLTSENSVRSLFAEIKKTIGQHTEADLKHRLRWSLDPDYISQSGNKLSREQRSRVEREIADLLKDPKKIDGHPGIQQPMKERIGLILSHHHMLLASLGLIKTETGINPFAVFGACADDKLLDGKLWRRRDDLSRTYPL